MRLRPGLGILLVACLALSVGYGVRQCLGLFIVPLEAARGWSAGVFALAFALQNLIWGIAQPFVGAVADRFGSRLTVAAGGLLFALGIGVMATTGSPVMFAWGGGTLLGLALAATSFGVLIGPVAALVPPERRSVAFGLLGAGGSLGQLFYPPFAQVAIGGVGWFPTLIALATIGIGIIPLAFVLREPPRTAAASQSLSLGAALREAFTVPSYGLLSAGFFVCGFHIAFFQTHLPQIVARAGLSPGLGAAALAIVGAFNVLGSYASGRLADVFPKRYVLSAIYGLRFVAMLIFVLVPISAFSVLAFSSAMGLLWLSTVAPTSGVIAEKFGMQWVSTLFGITFLVHQIGAFFGAWLGGVIVDRTGSYNLMWVVSLGLAAFAFLIQFPIDERPLARVAASPATSRAS
ncbi:MAG: MFS transporter [Candidatus Elarobacter sp.]